MNQRGRKSHQIKCRQSRRRHDINDIDVNIDIYPGYLPTSPRYIRIPKQVPPPLPLSRYNRLLILPSTSGTAFFAHSLNTFLTIFPLANFGTSSTKTIPPWNHLCFATRGFTHSWISSGVTFPLAESCSTTYPRGNSSSWTVMPTTAASAIEGWVKRRASSSAGATCRPETLISS